MAWLPRTPRVAPGRANVDFNQWHSAALPAAPCGANIQLDDLGNRLAVYQPSDPGGLKFLDSLRACDVLVLDDFLTTPITMDTTAKILNILASREGRGATIVTSQFDPEDWYKSLHDAVIAESILSRLVSVSEIVQLDGPNMRRETHEPRVTDPS